MIQVFPARTAPCGPRRPHRTVAWLSLAIFGLALVLSTGPDARAATAPPASTMVGSTAVPTGDARESDLLRDGQRDVSRAKKPRLGALRIRALRAMVPFATQGGRPKTATPLADARDPSPGLATMPPIAARRTDPALRLHPGQAPPRAA